MIKDVRYLHRNNCIIPIFSHYHKRILHIVHHNSSHHKNIQRMISYPLHNLSSMESFSTHSCHPTSHQKRTLLSRLLFTSFNHFQTNIFNSFSSSNITSKTNITHETSVHLFQSLSNKYFQLILIIQHHIENEHY